MNLYNIKFTYFIFKYNYYYINNINFSNLVFYYLNTNLSIFLKYVNYIYFLKWSDITLFFYVYNTISNLFILKIILNSCIKKKISNIFMPKKYKLVTLLRSPHIDKRSREQFHIIKYKSVLRYPLFFTIQKSNLLNNFFLFEKGFNLISNSKIRKNV